MLVWIGVVAAAVIVSVSTSTAAYQAIAVTDGGTIRGAIRFAGTPPEPKTVAITKDPEVCGKEKTSADILVSASKGLRNAVVRLTDIRQGKPLPKPKTVTLRQKGCEYSPRVMIFPAGSRVRIENEDGILHNTNTLSEANPSFTLAQPKYRRLIEKRIEEPEMPIRVRCDVHSWMEAWWISQEHPYYALTDAEGTFALDDVPPGNYTLEAWHETLGKVSRKITLDPKSVVDVTLEMSRR